MQALLINGGGNICPTMQWQAIRHLLFLCHMQCNGKILCSALLSTFAEGWALAVQDKEEIGWKQPPAISIICLTRLICYSMRVSPSDLELKPIYVFFFCRKCPSLRAQKWHIECPNKNSETTFKSTLSAKNDGIAFGFRRLSLLNGF